MVRTNVEQLDASYRSGIYRGIKLVSFVLGPLAFASFVFTVSVFTYFNLSEAVNGRPRLPGIAEVWTLVRVLLGIIVGAGMGIVLLGTLAGVLIARLRFTKRH